MRTYETVIVIDAHQPDEKFESLTEKVKKLITDNNGKVLEVSRWGKRRLAYEIKKKQHGYYIHFLYEMEKREFLKIIEREFKLTEEILRYLTLHLDKKALNYKLKKRKNIVGKVEKEDKEKVKVPDEKK